MKFSKKLMALGLSFCMTVMPWSSVAASDFTDVQTGSEDLSDDFSDGENFSEEENTENTNQDTAEDFQESDSELEEEQLETSEPEEIQESSDEGLNLKEPSSVVRKEDETSEQEEEFSASGEFNDGSSGERKEEIFSDGAPAAASESEMDVDATEIQMYALDENYSKVISIPNTLMQSYQIQTSGKNPVYKIVSGDSVKVSDTGLVTPGKHLVSYGDGNGNTVKEEWEYEFGESLVSVKAGSKTVYYKFTVNDYADYYAEEKMNTFLRDNITAEMSDYQKVETIAKWLANNFNYSPYHSGYTGLMIDGGGDCWANTSAAYYMCEKLGLTVYGRYAANDPGAGSGHRNLVVIIDGERYLLDCGYVGDAPRYYEFSKMDYDYSYEILDDGTIRIYQYEGTDTNIVVPDTIDGRKVTVIGSETFQCCHQAEDIESIVLPETLTTIEQNVFYNCGKLKSVTIPKNVSSIGLAAFVEGVCQSNLTEIKVDPDNPYFSEKDGVIFSKDGTKLIVFPSGRSGDYQIPEGTVSVEDYAFYYCVNITSITVPGTVKSLGKGAFGDCISLKKVILNEGLEEVGEYAFQESSNIHEITVPASVKKVEQSGFHISSDCRMRVLGTDTDWADDSIYDSTLVAGKEGSTIQKYAADHSCIFVKLGEDNRIPLQDEWFEQVDEEYEYDGEKYEPEIVLKNTAPDLEPGSEYEVTYENNVNAGTAVVKITGKDIFSGTVKRKFKIAPIENGFDDCYFEKNKFIYLETWYTGKKVEPKVIVAGLKEGKDYKVKYVNNNKPGEAHVEITGTGNYRGQQLYITLFMENCQNPMLYQIRSIQEKRLRRIL